MTPKISGPSSKKSPNQSLFGDFEFCIVLFVFKLQRISTIMVHAYYGFEFPSDTPFHRGVSKGVYPQNFSMRRI